MNILIFGLNYAPEPTGIGKYTADMAAWLAARGHRVEVITTHPYYPEWKIAQDYLPRRFMSEWIDGVRVHRVPTYVPPAHKVNAQRRILQELTFLLASSFRWIWYLLRNQRFDLVVAICPPTLLGIYPWIYSKISGVPWIFHIQDLQVDAALKLGIMQQTKLSKVLFQVEGFLMRQATKVSTITMSMRQRIELKGIRGTKTVLFPNWAEIEHIRPLPKQNHMRKKIGIKAEEVVVLYSGNMGKKQGLEIILEAAKVLSDHPGVQFLLIGNGTERSRLQKMAEEKKLVNVIFGDLVAWHDMPYLLAAADIHLVIQRPEAADLVMPSKLTNILSAGGVTVATALHGTELYSVLTDNQIGVVTPPEDENALTKAILKLVKEPQLRIDIGKAARAYAVKNLSKNTILTDFVSICSGIGIE